MEPKFPCLWYLLSPGTSVQAWFRLITDYRARPCDILYYASHVHRSLWRRSHQAHCNASPVDIFQYHNNKHYLKYAEAWPTVIQTQIRIRNRCTGTFSSTAM
jgi:hypothetical protein